MASSAQQANGANTLIVSSSLIPFSSASQLSSVNSSLANTQTSLITQNQLAQQQPLFQVFPETFQLPQLYQQQQMFLPPASLTVQPNSIQTTGQITSNDQLNKKKANKQQKIVSKTLGNQQQMQKTTNLQAGVKSNMLTGQHQFATTQNHNQAVVISQLPNLIQNSPQNISANKKLLEAQKNKQILIQNNAITQQSLVGSQFKPQQLHQANSQAHLLAQQSQLINPTQLITPIQQIPQSTLAWAQPNQLVQGSPHIFIRQPHSGTDGGGLFIQGSNPTALQPMPGTPIYMNNTTGGIMQLLQNHHPHTTNLSTLHQPILTTTSVSTSASTSTMPNCSTNVTQSKQQQFNNSIAKLKTIKSTQSLNNSLNSQGSIKTVKVPIISNNSKEDGLKKLSKKQSLDKTTDKSLEKCALDQSKFFTKSTQQMNSNESKLKKQSSLDEDSSSSSMNSKSTSSGGLLKKDKSEKKVKQKAIVKPQILSHCVDGYIIHESSFPFPINVTEELNDELEQIKLNNNSNIDKKQVHDGLIKEINSGTGKIKSKKLKKSKLKSSTPAKNSTTIPTSIVPQVEAKLVNEIIEKKIPELNLDEPVIMNNSITNKERKSNVVSVAPISETSSLSNNNASITLDESNVYKWSVEQVYEYLIKQEVSEAIAIELRKAQIDGKSITLLTIPILKDRFMFKLGPILSFKKKIDELKEKSSSDESSLNSCLPPSGNNIFKWSVKDTYQFILNLSSKQQYADEFEKQEMDGYSLTLINLDNIIGDMNIPYGPALVIYNRIEELKKNSTNN